MLQRDKADNERKHVHGEIEIAPDAMIIDTSDMKPGEVFFAAKNYIDKKIRT